MKIARTSYADNGELHAPRSVDVKMAGHGLGDITLDSGYYHLADIAGRSPRELAALRQQFIDTLATAPSGRVLSVREYEVKMDSFVSYGMKIIYVVEPPVAERRTMTDQDYLIDSLTRFQR